LAACLILPLALLAAMQQFGWFAGLSHDNHRLELLWGPGPFQAITNAQFWWAIALSLPVYYALRRFTRASVFSLVFAVMSALLCLDVLLRTGLLEWIENDPGNFYFHLMPFAILFLAAGYLVERLGHAADSRYLYPIALVFTLTAMSGVAAQHQPWADWLKSTAPWT